MIARAAAVYAALVLALSPGTAWADGHHDNDSHKGAPDTGCCFSFDHSPVTVPICTTANACQFGGKP